MYKATFTWDAVAGVDGYNVYLNKDGAGYVKINTSPISALTYEHEVDAGSYDAYVTSFANGLESDPSNVESFVVQPAQSAYRYYRWYISSGDGGSDGLCAIQELELYSSIGSANLITSIGGSSFSSGGWNGRNKFFDGIYDAVSPGYVFNTNIPGYVGWDFGSDELISQIGVYTMQSGYIFAFTLQGSNDFSVWEDIIRVEKGSLSPNSMNKIIL